MIPESIDVQKLLQELNLAGWRDSKIELTCGFAKGYISALKVRRIKNPGFVAGAKLLNLHFGNCQPQVEQLSVSMAIIAA